MSSAQEPVKPEGREPTFTCPNCDAAMPEGCGGTFQQSDGQSCWLNRDPETWVADPFEQDLAKAAAPESEYARAVHADDLRRDIQRAEGREPTPICTHYDSEQDQAIADGMCPICLQRKLSAAQAQRDALLKAIDIEVADREAAQRERDTLLAVINTVMAIPHMTDEQLEQLKANCRAATSREEDK